MNKSKRLISLDALRGFTVAGMILVNVPGSWSHIYWPFEHAHFNGLTLADLVFPFFLYIVGASIVLAFGKRLEQGIPKSEMVKKVISRSIIIFALGVFLNWMSSDFSFPLRIAGVLQRIAICYLAGSLLFIYTSRVVMFSAGIVFILGYWVLTMFVPIPGVGKVFTFDMSWTAWIDGKLLPGKMYFRTWDPEGLLSTLPSIATTITGMLVTYSMAFIENKNKKVHFTLITGFVLLVAGLLLAISFPINKNVWSSSFVLVTGALATLIWGVLIYFVDIKGWVKWTKSGVMFGSNAITAYVLHYLLAYPLGRWSIGQHTVQGHFMNFFSGFLPAEMASLLWAMFFVSVCFLPVWWMFRKKIFVKI